MKLNYRDITGRNDLRDRLALRYAAAALKKRHIYPKIVPPCLKVLKHTPPESLDQDGRDCLARLFPKRNEEAVDEAADALDQFLETSPDVSTGEEKEALLDHLILSLQQDDSSKEDSLLNQVERNVSHIAELVGLGETEAHFLFTVAACQYSRGLEDLTDELIAKLRSASETVSCLLDISREEAHRLTLPDCTLRRSGVLLVDESDCSFYGWFKLVPRLERILARPYENVEQLQKDIIGEACRSELEPEDFAHLNRDQDLLVRLLQGTREQEPEGINILIHGPPGTGKTEFAKVASAAAGLSLYPAGEEDEKGFEPMRSERLQDLLLLQNILCLDTQSAVLVDDAEDLFEWNLPVFRGNSSTTGSKVFLNRLLEENNRPIIWIVNDLSSIPVRVRRRMTFSIRMGLPPAKVRARIWERMARTENLTLTTEETDQLSRFLVSPGVGANGLRAAALASGNLQDVEHAITGIQQALSGAGTATSATGRDTNSLDLRLFNTQSDLPDLLERLAQGERRDISFCLYGHPGTGKTELAHLLAETLGMDVLEKRASDLLGPYVGQTEASIASAFAEARERDAVLVFDEADSLLAERSQAHRQFEITQVNEMLSQMERHPLPFICTTNLMERIDQASLRRFTFKLKFNYLTESMVLVAFRGFYQMEPPERLRTLRNLTPADFALVRHKANVLGTRNDHQALVQMLQEEAEAKSDDLRHPLGFHAA
ncbi:AAA family ATPase [Fodinicurvata halophila]|uniref:AAA family ATPase n=1 Tax=Fodinicurvata halophila TaxID=1419723 RepID=A0ABV8UNW2_9PROT